MPEKDTCPKCGKWTDKGKSKLEKQHREHPLYGVDFSKPLSDTIEEIRNGIVNLRGKLFDIRMGYPGWGDQTENVSGLLTCGLIVLYEIREQMKKVEEARKKDEEKAP
jgi:hypothetical protein